MELCNVCYKTIHTRHTDPEEWVGDLVKNSIQYRADSIYKLQLEKHLSEGTMPAGATEKAYKIRYLDTDGNITDEANAVHIAAFVGCTYHCG